MEDNDILHTIEYMPIVRCKDCKFGYREEMDVELSSLIRCNIHGDGDEYNTPDWFCPDGTKMGMSNLRSFKVNENGEHTRKKAEPLIFNSEVTPGIDFVKVVRCKDCKFSTNVFDDEYKCEVCEFIRHQDWFCAYGRKRDD